MTPVVRTFVGWERPLAEVAAELILREVAPPAVDLKELLIVVPTRQAGRRLGDAMALRAERKGAALLSPRIIPPTRILDVEQMETRVATATEQLSAWLNVLREVAPDTISHFLPAIPDSRDAGWCLKAARQLIRLRGSLADGAYSIGDVLHKEGDALYENERWQEMAMLEQRYLELLDAEGLTDVQIARIRLSREPVLDEEIRKVIVVGVSDPSLLTLRAVEQLASTRRVEIIVQAPESCAALFDQWGRPLPEAWVHRRIPLELEHFETCLAADPEAQARACVAQLAAESGRRDLCDCAVGVPDQHVIPFLREALAEQGVACFDPQDLPLTSHSACRLVLTFLDLLETGRYRCVADLLRHPDVLSAGIPGTTSGATCLLKQLDEFQNMYLPLRLPEMLARFRDNPKGTDSRWHDFGELGLALQWISNWLKQVREQSIPSGLRALLQEIYRGRELQPDDDSDIAFCAAAGELDAVLRESERIVEQRGEPDDMVALLRARLQESSYHRERTAELIDLEGWLELQWSDASMMVVTGLNEGAVPDGQLSDMFLPDSLRAELGLRDDRLRLARDAHALTCLCEQRREQGRLVLLCGKRSSAGDPLKPSRLLFRCEEENLVERARLLFGEIEESRPMSPASISFKLDPQRVEQPECVPDPVDLVAQFSRLSVTDFRGYLRCPFRFYLQRGLDMAPLSDNMRQLDLRVYGTLVHDVLELMGADRKLWACEDVDVLGQTLESEARRTLREQFGANPPLEVVVARESAVQRLRRVAQEQVKLYAAGWEILYTEQRYSMTRQGVEIVGRIDRVDRHRERGCLRVLDYKTSDRADEPSSKHFGPVRDEMPDFTKVLVRTKSGRESQKRWVDLQLPLYRLLLSANGIDGAADAGLGYFAIAKALQEIGVKVWEEYTESLHESAVECVDGVIAAIQARRFWPPLKQSNPDYDDFRYLLLGEPEECIHFEGVSDVV